MNQQNNKSNDTHWYNIIAKIYNDQVFNETIKYQKQYGFDIITGKDATWNNEADAFKHTFMQAQLSLLVGDNAAKVAGNFHEWQGNIKNNQDKAEEQMDQWNNAQGREIAKEIWQEYGIKSKKAFAPEIKDIIARKVIERMQAGKLILDPTGRKTPKKKLNIPGVNKGTNNENDRSKSHSQKSCVGSYQVSGYTRSDGTEVKGYTRTCGAKHSGMSKEERLAGQEKYNGKKFQDIPQSELEDAMSYFI